ncbi:FG-GAP repeat domain-containing protein [Micromonospora auratinigra]|uniref:Repeat domain-containing protein n=1 Tax=Micromonospora auratinigra TaxID=261654 RepID=A0A1A8ZZK4_9ACTN|nr:VCBS repeat-containing protein [Micromonospora auratinigra]SBT49321.1 Repeat domain-containing protein [Micromonospora auratinigra]
MGRSPSAGALASILALGLLVAPAAPAAADTGTAPREIAVFPESPPTVFAHEAIVFAGATGFLHRRDASTDYLWTRYDSGETVVVKDLAGLSPLALRSAGGDLVLIRGQVPAKPAPGKFSVLDLSDQSWQQLAPPTGYILLGFFGRTLLARTGTSGVAPELFTLAADGTWTGTAVSGLPAGANATITPIGDLTSAVLPYSTPGGSLRYGLLDLATASVRPLSGPVGGGSSGGWRLTGDSVAWASVVNGEGVYQIFSRSGVTTGTNTEARVLTTASERLARSVIVGDGVVGAMLEPESPYYRFPAISASTDATSGTTVLPMLDWGSTALVQAPDGRALAVGGTSAKDWAVHRLSAEPGTAPAATPLLPVRDAVGNAGLVYHQGQVRHAQTEIDPTTGTMRYAVFNHPLVTDASTRAGGTPLRGKPPAACPSDVPCLPLVEGNRTGAAYVAPGLNGAADTLVRFDTDAYNSQETPLTTHHGRLVDVGNGYVLVNDGATNNQQVVDVARGAVVRTAPTTGAALWFSTLWTATGTAGQLKAVDLTNGRTTRTVSTGTPCVPSEVQTSARWLWWACGSAGPAGVYDLQGNRALTVPAGPAQLGDGFLVRHEAGALRLTDFHDGTVRAPVELADLPVGNPADGRRLTWAVDRHGAGVAYVDANDAVHVLDTGVPATSVQLGGYETSGDAFPRAEVPGMSVVVHPTRPLVSWTMTISRKWTGEVVHRASGGTVRELFLVSWNGRLASGQPALNGPYRWTVTGTTGEGSSAVTIGSAEFRVGCGTFPFRGYDCYGGPGLLGVKSTGEGHWYGTRQTGTVPGRLYDNGWTDNWCLSCTGAARTTALVPFGDFNGDALPDLLVRDGNGYLKAHLGIGQLYFGANTTKSLGGGWGGYKAILAPGDLNSDHHDDILAVDTYGKLWLSTTTGAGGIRSRVQVGSGWNMYTRIIGAGDLNGDGHGDLLGIDTYGVMYRYLSNGRTGWSARARIYGGWKDYTAVIAIGDLNEDGHNDLLARDTHGVLWHYAGTGTGTFTGRVKAGTGWNMYKTLA